MCLPVFFPSSILHRDLLLLLSLCCCSYTHASRLPLWLRSSDSFNENFRQLYFLFFPCELCYVSHSVKWIALSLLAFKSYIDMAISSRR